MTKPRHIWVFCYDVTDNGMRKRLADLLLDHAVRVQESVFEGRMTKTAAKKLARECARYILPGDSLRAYRITDRALEDCLAIGGAPVAEAGDFWLV